MPPAGHEPPNPSKQAAADLQFRPRGHLEMISKLIYDLNNSTILRYTVHIVHELVIRCNGHR